MLEALKARINRTGGPPGEAVLTESTRHDALPRTAQSLTGRLHTLRLLPLSQGEIVGVHENLIEALFADAETAVFEHSGSSTTREGYVERVCAGGMPLALRRSPQARARWFDDYVKLSVERDALELAKIRQRDVLATLLHRVAAQTAQPLNVSAVASDIGVARSTVTEYVQLLIDLFLIHQLPAWGTTLRSRVTKQPKVHLIDSGLAARLMRATEQRLATFDPSAMSEFGHLMETFVVNEICKQVSWMEVPVAVGHWRTSDGVEVDCVLEHDDGRVLAFEVKANQRVRSSDTKGLRQLRTALGDRLVAGIVFTAGEHAYRIDDNLFAFPIDRLWTTVAAYTR